MSKINFHNMDCMDFMRDIPDEFYDLAIVDVNYGIKEDGRKTKGRTFRKDGSARLSIDKRTGRKALIYNNYDSKNWDDTQPEQKYFDELFRVAKKHIIWGCNYLIFNQKNDSTGRIFWDKVNFDNDFADGELAWTNVKKTIRQIEFMWNGMLQGKSAVNGRINQGNKKKCEKRIHPTQKPVALYRWLLQNYAKPGQKILDTHAGSLSIGIACGDLGYSLDACELDEDYFFDSSKRLYNHFQQTDIFQKTPEIKIHIKNKILSLREYLKLKYVAQNKNTSKV